MTFCNPFASIDILFPDWYTTGKVKLASLAVVGYPLSDLGKGIQIFSFYPEIRTGVG